MQQNWDLNLDLSNSEAHILFLLGPVNHSTVKLLCGFSGI